VNNNDIFDALSGIDPKYIEEAAHELQTAKVVDITQKRTKRNIGKFVKIVLPSVAAILLIVGVALPAVLRVSKSESAAMSDAAASAPAAEAASEAPAAEAEAAGAEEATAMADEAATAEAPASAEEAAEPSATNDMDTVNPDAVHEYRKDAEMEELEPLPAKPAETEEAAEAAPEEPWVIKEADYDRDILIIRCGGTIPADLADLPFTLERTDVAADKAKVKAGAKLSELSERIEVTDNWIVIDLIGSDLKLEKGKYRLFMGDAEAEFEVK
jgi:hypothetical protein